MPKGLRILLGAMLFAALLSAYSMQAQTASAPSDAATPVVSNFALHDGDRVVFYGDSITEQRLYTTDVEDFALTRYPALNAQFHTAGVGGDTVYGGWAGTELERLARDVFPLKPTVVTIMLGMNDGHYSTKLEKNFLLYKAGYRKLVQDLKTGLPGVRLTFIEPSPYDEITRTPDVPGYNEVLLHYCHFVAQLGQQQGAIVSNFNGPVNDALAAVMHINPSLAALLLPDHIHPGPAVHWLMAATLMRTWKVSPIVSDVSLDATQANITQAQNAQVTNLTHTADGLRWTQLDQALPLPLPLRDERMQEILQLSDLASFDQQMLRVQDLTATGYQLKIDGQVIGMFTRGQLLDGVNLALYSTPMEAQAQAIEWLTQRRASLDRTYFLLTLEKDQTPDVLIAEKTLQAMDAKVVVQQHKDAQPKPHEFALIAQPLSPATTPMPSKPASP